MNTNQFVLVAFGNCYVADPAKTPNGLEITDRIEEAMIFDGRDNPEIKRVWWTSYTGMPFEPKAI